MTGNLKHYLLSENDKMGVSKIFTLKGTVFNESIRDKFVVVSHLSI